LEIGSKGFEMLKVGATKPKAAAGELLASSKSPKDAVAPDNFFKSSDVKKQEPSNKLTDFKKALAEKTSKNEATAPSKNEVPAATKNEAPALSKNEIQNTDRVDTKLESVNKKTSVEVVELENENTKFNVDDKAVMIEFLGQMQKELNVEPKAIVEAMMSLSDEDLAKPLEETMAQVLAQLNLTPPQREKAELMYQEMLTDMSRNSIARWAEVSGRKIDTQVMGPEQIQQMKSLQSVEKLSQQFFTEPKAVPADAEQAPRSEEAKPFFPSYAAAGKAAYAKMGQQTAPRENTPAMKPVATTGADSPKTIDLASLGLSSDMAGKSLEAASIPAAPSLDKNTTPTLSASSTDGSKTLENSLVSGLSMESKSDQGEFESEPDNSDSASEGSSFSQFVGEKSPAQDGFVKTVAGAAGMPIAKSADEQANIRNVLQGAQVLIQKGGGEMKVQLTPEGMGSVDLKVNVKDGKVDIQMMTDSAETKRLLESGLEDLRGNLVQHKLSLETMKIDTPSSKLGTALDQQYQNQERENAREFLGQFRDFNNSRRNNFHEASDLRAYGSVGRKLRPEDVQMPTTSSAKTKRLDLVA
jgi:flagellar hook-length control protein FliK